MPSRHFPRLSPIFLSISLATIPLTVSLPVFAQAERVAINEVRNFSIAPGNLDQVLRRFGLEAEMEFYLDGSLSQGISSNGLQGQYSPLEGLQLLLKGTGLTAIQQAGGAYRIGSPAAISQNNQLTEAPVALDAIDIVGDNFAFSRDEQGYNDVYDKNISSTYAGKEQLERFKGAAPADMLSGMMNVYSGDARNSGALDPNIRGIQGPGRVPVTIDGTEQAITVWRGYMGANNRSYIDPNLIGRVQVFKGPNLERDVHSGIGGAVVASTLSVDDILKPGKSFGGELKVEGSNNSITPNVPGLSTGQSYTDIPGFDVVGFIHDPTLLVEPRSGGNSHFDDYAYRLALGARQEFFEVMGAYAYRKKGNHFSGKRQDGFYSRGMPEGKQWNYIPDLANIYRLGDEVPNTSNEMESWLTKAKLKFSDEQSLAFSYRDTSTTYGELFPSRIAWETAADNGVPQWPLSDVEAKAYNLEYNFNPANNNWVDFYASLWKTETVSNTYTAGGYPNEPYKRVGDTRLRNTALRNANEDRKGVTLSNAFTLMDNLSLTLGGRFQREKLSSDDIYLDPEITGTGRMYPKAGERQEKDFTFNVAWKPTNVINIDAGMRYSSFWTFDDFRKERFDAGDTAFTSYRPIIGRTMYYKYDREVTLEDVQPSIDRYEANRAFYEMLGLDVDAIIQKQLDIVGSITSATESAVWEVDRQGRYSRENHPCLATEVEITACHSHAEILGDKQNIQKVKKLKGDGWAPALSIAWDITDTSRIYARHIQAYRFPSLFENTLSFSASLLNPNYELKPEHIYSYEIGYVQNLTKWLDAEYADLKLSYFYNRTKNVIDRDPGLNFMNLEKQTIEGIEFEGRYDTGKFFSNLSLAYNFRNEVCDENSAVRLDYRATSDCVDDGFIGGYLVSMAMPKYTAHLDVGGRFFNRKLEVGSRFTYHYKHEDKFDSNYRDPAEITYFTNTPLSWDTILLVDAYASYQVNDTLSVDLIGSNLTNEYYVDPMTRSAIAAPGRTFRLGLTARF